MFKVIIAGSRDFSNYSYLKNKMDIILSSIKEDVEIVSGKAPGADTLGENYAKERNYPIKPFPADWNKFGKRAGPIRNSEMSEYADACVCFWDGKSDGTKNMIDVARKNKLKLRIINFSTNEVFKKWNLIPLTKNLMNLEHLC